MILICTSFSFDHQEERIRRMEMKEHVKSRVGSGTRADIRQRVLQERTILDGSVNRSVFECEMGATHKMESYCETNLRTRRVSRAVARSVNATLQADGTSKRRDWKQTRCDDGGGGVLPLKLISSRSVYPQVIMIYSGSDAERECAFCGALESVDGGPLSQCKQCSMVVYCGEEHKVTYLRSFISILL
uniref:MYND-type domain-containing protein n=1 Tax=Setaria digitata TaxID=48799 RepID=A0A915PQK7_9BILA